MKPSLLNSPTRLALLSALGSLIVSVIFVLPWSRREGGLLGVSVLLGLAVFAGGGFLSLKSGSNLKHGIQNQDWPESQIEPLRKHLESQYYTALSFALLIAFAVLGIIFTRFRGAGWVCYLLWQTISQLRMAVRRPVPGQPSGPLACWRDFLAPIHSDQWGQR